MKYYSIIISLFVFSCTNSQIKEIGRIISSQEFAKEITQEGIELIDVRTIREYEAGHIENSKNIDVLKKEEFTRKIQKLDKNKPIYIYCRTGNRSREAAKILHKAGFKDIIDLKGGYLAWEQK